MRRALLLVLLLAACAPEPPATPSFRDRGVPMGSTTRGTLADLAGDWEVTAGFSGAPFAAPSTHLRVEPLDATRARLVFEGPGGVRDVVVRTGVPGRLVPEDGSAEIWVLWVDDDFRTAVVGTPDGSFGWVMDRPGQASPDRAAAAREVLEWSGYDLSALVAGTP